MFYLSLQACVPIYLLKVKRMTLIKQVANKSFPCYTSPRLPLAYCHF